MEGTIFCSDNDNMLWKEQRIKSSNIYMTKIIYKYKHILMIKQIQICPLSTRNNWSIDYYKSRSWCGGSIKYEAGFTGADPGGGAPTARAPLKLEKYDFFWRKIVIFHTKYPKLFRASLRNLKKYDFLA